VVWYTGQFYALFFLGSVLKVDIFTTNVLIAWSLVLGSGGFVFFGWLSDKIGRKPIILGGCLLAALTYFPLFKLMSYEANPALTAAHTDIATVVRVDQSTCSFQFNPTGTAKFTQALRHRQGGARRGSRSTTRSRPAGPADGEVRVGDQRVSSSSPTSRQALATAVTAAGYPAAANPTVVRMSGPVRRVPRAAGRC
jgi:hypothetical protein